MMQLHVALIVKVLVKVIVKSPRELVCSSCCFMLQSAIWQCLNNYDYADAVFLSERLYAEGEKVMFITVLLLAVFME